jgi:hypothetical protein
MRSMKRLLWNCWPEWLNRRPASSEAERKYRPHDVHDIYHVAFILRQVLIPDLVPPILDLAEYWTKTTHDLRQLQSCVEYTSGTPYLSAPLSNALGPRMVRKVEFSITSHDQGWSSDNPQLHGTYEASWTWFEAVIHNSEGGRFNNLQKELCRNVHAERCDKTHIITWRYDAEDSEERDLVRSFEPGSSISIVPWARYSGWQNHVSCASIDIYVAAVRKL